MLFKYDKKKGEESAATWQQHNDKPERTARSVQFHLAKGRQKI